MKEKFIKIIIHLLSVKTIITLIISMLFVVLAYNEKLPIETTTMIIGMVFTYYFSREHDIDK